MSECIRRTFARLSEINEQATKRAILNHVWTLTDAQIADCEVYFRLRTTAGKFLERMSTGHDWIDYIQIPGKGKFVVNYINGSTAYLEDLKETGKADTLLMLSFRGSGKNKTYACLVLINPKNMEALDERKIRELV